MREKHGMTNHQAYQTWENMKQRCDNPKKDDYQMYGGNGIKYCEKWNKFSGFWEDMGSTWKPKLSIDRIDGNKGYYKENCRWATPIEQSENRRVNVFITYNGEKHSVHGWDRIIFKGKYIIQKRLKMGWSIDKIMNTPIIERYSHKKHENI